MLEALLERFRRGDRVALARLLTLLSRGEAVQEITARIEPVAAPSCVVAITGSGGVGKSTLIGKLIEHIRGQGQTVAVLACDPESPLTGGALLGDRFRMPNRPDDPGVFIRSLAAASGEGPVARYLPEMVRLLQAFGFDFVLVETVGAGQGDTAIRSLADVVVLLLQPETGDDLQWEKAGLLEVADIVAIHKADLPQAEAMETQVRNTLQLDGNHAVPVLRVSAKTGDGIAALWQEIEKAPGRRSFADTDGRELLRAAQQQLAQRFAAETARQSDPVRDLIARWQQGNLPDSQAAAALLQLLARSNP